MSQARKPPNPKVTIIASKGANKAINDLLEDPDELESLVPSGTTTGDIFLLRYRRRHPPGLGRARIHQGTIVSDYFGESDE